MLSQQLIDDFNEDIRPIGLDVLEASASIHHVTDPAELRRLQLIMLGRTADLTAKMDEWLPLGLTPDHLPLDPDLLKVIKLAIEGTSRVVDEAVQRLLAARKG